MLAYAPLAVLLAVLAAPAAYADVPDLIVEASANATLVDSGDPVGVSGSVYDHGYEPVAGAEVTVRTGGNTTVVETGQNGTFAVEYAGAERAPGTHTINVQVTWEGLSGLASAQFQVRGDADRAAEIERQLGTDTAKRYLGANATDFARDPLGMRLYEYYNDMSEELAGLRAGDVKTAEEMQAEQLRRVAEKLRADALEKANLQDGTYGGYAYESYIRGLNPEIRDLVAGQLNFTNGAFARAQAAMDAVLESGGTYAEARQAYLDAMSVPRAALEEFNRNATGGNPPQTGTR